MSSIDCHSTQNKDTTITGKSSDTDNEMDWEDELVDVINPATRNNQSKCKYYQQQPTSKMPGHLHHIWPRDQHKIPPLMAKHRGRPCKPYNYLVNQRVKLKQALGLLQDWAITKEGFDQLKTDLWYVGITYCMKNTDGCMTQALSSWRWANHEGREAIPTNHQDTGEDCRQCCQACATDATWQTS